MTFESRYWMFDLGLFTSLHHLPIAVAHVRQQGGRYRELTASVGSSANSSPRKITKLPAQGLSSVSPCR